MDLHTAHLLQQGVRQVLHSQGVLNDNILLGNYLAILGRVIEGCIAVMLVFQHFAILECKRRLERLLVK